METWPRPWRGEGKSTPGSPEGVPGPGSRRVQCGLWRRLAWTPRWRGGRQGRGLGGVAGSLPTRAARAGGPSGAGRDGVYLRSGTPPLPHPGEPTLHGPGSARGRGRELRRGPGGWGRLTSGFYHGGGGGGGPGPGVCGSPPSSRARRFHFPGCPGVNIRVSAPLPPAPGRRHLPSPPRPGPGPPPRSRLSANERAGPRRSPSMERGAGGRSADQGSEGRGLQAGPGAAAGGVGGPRSVPRVAARSAPELTPGEDSRPHPDPTIRSGAAGAGGLGGPVPADLPSADAEGTGAGRGQSLPTPPGTRAHSRGGPGTGAIRGPGPARRECSA